MCESFIGFIQMEKTNAEAITNAIMETLRKVGLNTNFLRAQCYDGASVMSGFNCQDMHLFTSDVKF